MNFIFDRGGKVLYRLAAKPARVQGVADELTIYFSQLRLEGRDKYRLILVGEPEASFEKGSKIAVEIRINEGSGFRRQPVILSSEVKDADHRNFEFDFDAPDVPTITDLKVGLQAHLPIRTALMFIRHRFYAGRAQDAPRAVEATPPPAEPPVSRTPARDYPSQPREYPPAREHAPSRDYPPPRVQEAEPPPARSSRLEPRAEPPAVPGDVERAPWEQPAPPPRRRRLE